MKPFRLYDKVITPLGYTGRVVGFAVGRCVIRYLDSDHLSDEKEVTLSPALLKPAISPGAQPVKPHPTAASTAC